MATIFSFNYVNPDYNNYYYFFENIRGGGDGFITSQVGLKYYYMIISYLGFEYQVSVLILYFFGFLFILLTVRRFSNNYIFVFVLYFIYPFLLDVVQVKHFIAMSLIIYSFNFLSQERVSILSLFIILFAATFHYIAIFFIPVIFLVRFSLRYNTFFSSILCVFVFVFVYFGFHNFFFSSDYTAIRLQHYLVSNPGYGFLAKIFIQLIFTFIVFTAYIKIKDNIKDENALRYSRIILIINIYLVILFPLYMINGNFERVYRILYIPNYILISIYLSLFRVNVRFIYSLLFVVFFLLISFWHFYEVIDLVVKPIFKYNIVFDLFRH